MFNDIIVTLNKCAFLNPPQPLPGGDLIFSLVSCVLSLAPISDPPQPPAFAGRALPGGDPILSPASCALHPISINTAFKIGFKSLTIAFESA